MEGAPWGVDAAGGVTAAWGSCSLDGGLRAPEAQSSFGSGPPAPVAGAAGRGCEEGDPDGGPGWVALLKLTFGSLPVTGTASGDDDGNGGKWCSPACEVDCPAQHRRATAAMALLCPNPRLPLASCPRTGLPRAEGLAAAAASVAGQELLRD